MIAILLWCFTGAMAQEHHRLTNLPHLYINTFTGRDVTSKTEQVWARLWLVDENDAVSYEDSVSIRGRGNSTWNLAKKPYRIKFEKKKRFLGTNHANAKKWTLLANHGDKTLFRNALASYIGDLCGQPFTPAAKYVDLTLNGDYKGCYQISDQIDVRKKRVDIAEQDYPLTDGSNLTGGYLVEADGFKDYINGVTGWNTSRGIPMTIHYPDDEEIVAKQFSYIRQFVNSFETRLFSNSYADPQKGYRAYVDSASLVSWYLASEITANPDYIWSMYFYKDRDDDHLYFGPLWDYDIAFNNDNRLSETTRQLMADVAFTNNGMENWIRRFWSDEWFQRLVFRHYASLYSQDLEAKLLNKIDSLSALLQQSQELNYQKWNIRTRYLREVVLYSTYDEYVADLRRFISVRLPALLSAFAKRQPDAVDIDDYEKIVPTFTPSPDYYYTIANAGTTTVFDLDVEGRLIANARHQNSHSQQWQIIALQNGYRQILNRMNGLALTDPTIGDASETTNLGTQIAVAVPDSADKAQQWDVVRQDNGYYNLNNRKTHHTANLTGGSSANGTTILSYTNDNRNASSKNRLWTLTTSDPIPIDDTGIHDIGNIPQEYALAYDQHNLRLHFGSDNVADLTFMVTVYDASGHQIVQFPASEGCSVAHLPKGLYIVSWNYRGRHSTKFIR